MSGKKISIFLIVLILIVAGFLVYRSQKNKKNQNTQSSAPQSSLKDSATGDNSASDNSDAVDANSDQADQDFEAQCAGGQWVKIADVEGEMISLTGKLRAVYPEDEIQQELKSFQFYVEGKEKTALSGSDLSSLDKFEDRDIEIQGAKSSDGKSVNVAQARCAGTETNKDLISQRNKVLEYISANINSIAPKKAPYQKWTVLSAGLVNENNIYIEYYDIAEDSENYDSEDTMHQVLLEIGSNPDGKYEAKVLAYWETAEEEYVLKSGTDKFENSEDVISYSYDSDDNSWSRD